jgi:hypothetical protein
MEQYNSTNKFIILNFNLKKIIFSYLSRRDQKTIYWLNKKLRNLLPDSPLTINIDNLRKCWSYKIDSEPFRFLELNDGTIACFTKKEINLFQITNNNNLELIKTLPIESYSIRCPPILFENGEIIFQSTDKDLTRLDKDFNFIESYKEPHITSFCKISESSFAVGSLFRIKIYSKNQNTQKNDTYKKYEYYLQSVYSIIYLPINNCLLIGALKYIHVLSLSEGKTIKTFYNKKGCITSLVSLNDEIFANFGFREIKIFSIKADTSIECIKTISKPKGMDRTILKQHVNNFMVVNSSKYEFAILDLKSYEFLKTYKEDSRIETLIVTKNNNIIIATRYGNLIMLKILV